VDGGGASDKGGNELRTAFGRRRELRGNWLQAANDLLHIEKSSMIGYELMHRV